MILLRYILKSHFVPFLFSAITLMGIFLLQFLMKFADRLVGKGLDNWIIFQLIAYNLAWMVVLVIPMSVLIASLMAFGGMSQNNEITILKASGISLYKMIGGPFVASIGVAYLLILFNNDVLPDANHQAKILMSDISQKKPTLSLEPGVFSQEIDNYALLAREIDAETNNLYNVTIYDYALTSKVNIVTAKKGKIYFSENQSKLVMDLSEGEIHESDASGTNLYRKLSFKKHRLLLNGEQFSFQQTSPGSSQRGDRELSAADMQTRVDSLVLMKAGYDTSYFEQVSRYFFGDPYIKNSNPRTAIRKLDAFAFSEAIEKARSAKNAITSSYTRITFINNEIDSYLVEINKKYSIPVACIVFILLGAPLGVMTRKGGFGMAASVSLFFFLIYWAFLIGGEKLADRGIITPFWGMWAANILVGLLGVFLTTRSVKETLTLDFSWMKKFVPKSFRAEEESKDENT